MNRPRFGIDFGPVTPKVRLVVGVLFVTGALLCGLSAAIAGNRAAARVERFQPIDVRTLVSSPPGTEVLIEGQVSAENPVLLQPYGFVVYVRERRSVWQEDGDWETGSWFEEERVTPPLLLDLAGTLIEVENEDYALHDAYSLEVPGGAGQPSDTRLSGLRAGEPALALGSVLGGKEVGRIDAEFIARGTRASYIAGQRSAGWIFAAAGLVVAVLGGVFLLRDPLLALWSSRRSR